MRAVDGGPAKGCGPTTSARRPRAAAAIRWVNGQPAAGKELGTSARDRDDRERSARTSGGDSKRSSNYTEADRRDHVLGRKVTVRARSCQAGTAKSTWLPCTGIRSSSYAMTTDVRKTPTNSAGGTRDGADPDRRNTTTRSTTSATRRMRRARRPADPALGRRAASPRRSRDGVTAGSRRRERGGAPQPPQSDPGHGLRPHDVRLRAIQSERAGSTKKMVITRAMRGQGSASRGGRAGRRRRDGTRGPVRGHDCARSSSHAGGHRDRDDSWRSRVRWAEDRRIGAGTHGDTMPARRRERSRCSRGAGLHRSPILPRGARRAAARRVCRDGLGTRSKRSHGSTSRSRSSRCALEPNIARRPMHAACSRRARADWRCAR